MTPSTPAASRGRARAPRRRAWLRRARASAGRLRDRGLERLTPVGAGAVAVALWLAVTVGDDLTGPDVSFMLLYLGPIGFAAWFVSLRLGLVLSVLSAMASLAIDAASRAVPLAGAVAAWNLAVQLGVFLAVVTLLGVLKDRLEAEQELARTDPLTRIPNRRAFVEAAALELERVRRTGRPLTVAYVDVDDFKQINDRYGHAEGDGVLAAVASTLRSETRSIDAVARLGGDEFGLLLVDTDGPAAVALVTRLRAALVVRLADRGFPVGFSVGASTFASPPRSVDEMLTHADHLMYDAKRSGKNEARFEIVGEPRLAG